MSIKIKTTGRKRGSTGYVIRVPIKDIDRLSDEDINEILKSIYGTDKVKLDYNHKLISFKSFLENVKRTSQFPDNMQEYFDLGKGKREIKGIYYDEREKNFDESMQNRWNKNFQVINDGKNITFKPVVALHGVTGRKYLERTRNHVPIPPVSRDSYRDLIKILDKGLRKRRTFDDDNVAIKANRERFSFIASSNEKDESSKGYSSWAEPSNSQGTTKGDLYTIEMIPSEGHVHNRTAKKTSPKNILSVNVEIDSSNSPEVVQEKVKFYQDNIQKRYGMPVRYFLHGHLGIREKYMPESYWENVKRVFPKKNLERRLTSMLSIGSFIASLGFLSSNITGNAIADLSVKTSSTIGIVLFAIALLSGFFWLRNRKKK